jgi:hypothetical protein
VKRGTVIFVGGLVAVLVAVVISYLFVVSGRELTPVPGSLPPAAELVARLESAQGDVQVRGTGSEWHAAPEGEKLPQGSQVRTGAEARALLVYGDGLSIQLAGSSDVQLAGTRPDLARLIVGEGLVFADVRPGSAVRVQIENKRGDAVTETHDGALSVSADDRGVLRAAVSRGTARLTAHGETVTLQQGYVSVARNGERPDAPTVVPASLLLKVRWPTDPVTAKRRHLITGQTNPGARLQVGSRQVWADDGGRFETFVDLREGKNRIKVEAVDVSRQKAAVESPELELDTHAPPQSIETSPDMWNKP